MMKKLILMVIIVLILTLFLFLFLTDAGYLKFVKRSEAFEMLGKRNPEKVEIKEEWLAKDKFAYFSIELGVIADYQIKLISTPTA
jgi:hypothetical protein